MSFQALFRKVFGVVFCLVGGCTVVEASEVSNYLEQLSRNLDTHLQDDSVTFHIVLGNESADLDSIAGAIARARYLAWESEDVDSVYYPVANLPREELRLRRDTEELFSRLGVKHKDVLFINELPLAQLAEKGRLRVHLVDHNALTLREINLTPWVVSIIDHHADEQVVYALCDESDKLVTEVGSAMTLIAHDFLTNRADDIDVSWATLLLAPILVDTLNLQSESKTTQLDIDTVKQLRRYSGGLFTDQFFEILLTARANVEGLSPDMLLRKDLKHYQDGEVNYTISSMPYRTSYSWQEDEKYLEALQGFLSHKGVPIAIVLEAPPPESANKERLLHVSCDSQERLEKVIHHFSHSKDLAEITYFQGSDASEATATWSLPVSISRKKLQPRLQLDQVE